VTPFDYEYLRKILKERSGLDLAADKQYLVESRLVPLARKAGIMVTRKLSKGTMSRKKKVSLVVNASTTTTDKTTAPLFIL
jgi:chemotaxis protein methyltransferase CheR